MNENENRMEPQVPDTEIEIADEMLEGASGGSLLYRGSVIMRSDGTCGICGEPVTYIQKYGYYYCSTCKRRAVKSASETKA